MDDWQWSGQIPAFGDWDYTNQMPITQYFDCAKQAGLVFRCNSLSGECGCDNSDLYSIDFKKPIRKTKGTKGRERGGRREQGKVCDMTELPPTANEKYQYNHKMKRFATTKTKPVDEDLYKIPPEMLHLSSKRKKRMGLLSCLVPACA